MKTNKKFLSFQTYLNVLSFSFLSLFFLISCEQEIDFTGEQMDPKIVINGYLSPDTTFTVRISKSVFFLDSKAQFPIVENATVLLYVNGEVKEQMMYTGNGIYQSTYLPRPEDNVKVTVEDGISKMVWCEEKIPSTIQILSLDTANIYSIDNNGNGKRKIKFGLKFLDPGQENYYRLVVYREIKQWTSGEDYRDYFFSFDDIVSGKNESNEVFDENTNRYNIFKNEIFSGKEYLLKFSVEQMSYDDYFSGTTKIYIKLQHISKSYYLYLKSLETKDDSSEIFSEPVQIYSNVNNGIGVLAGYTSSVIQLDLSK